MTTDQNKSPPLTWFEKQYGEITGLSHDEIERAVLSHALCLFDELNFDQQIQTADGLVTQDDDFSVWSFSAGKEFIQLMAYCRALRKSYRAVPKAQGQP